MLLCLSQPSLSISRQNPAPSQPLPLLAPPTTKPSRRSRNPKYSVLRASLSPPVSTKTLGKSAIQRISEKLRSLGYTDEENPNNPPADRPQTGPGSAGQILIPTPQQLPKHRVGFTIDSSWSTPENPVPEPGANIARFHDLWRRESAAAAARSSKASALPEPPTVAELTIPGEELRRLRTVGIRLEKRLKVGKAGITEGTVNGIHERWRRSELVKIKCEDLCRINMKRTHETLERKTGGLVIWRSGSIIILYRGTNYKYPYFYEEHKMNENLDEMSLDPSMDVIASGGQDGNLEPNNVVKPSMPLKTLAHSSIVMGVGSPKKIRLQLTGEVQFEEEVDRMLDGLGPRFVDWWDCNPLPIDADLLPAFVPGFRRPFRLLPFGVNPKLTDREMTILRRLGRPLPCHFALERNRNLQGLAASMIKLWEKCEIAKIAVKRRAQNTNSKMMAEELKRLTGGTLLLRDKEFIVFYRGKDYLPPAVSTAIQERRNYGIAKLREESMVESSPIAIIPTEPSFNRSASFEGKKAIEQKTPLAKLQQQNSANIAVKRVETRLFQTLERKEHAEKLLAELEKSSAPSIVESDKEAISEEERHMLRKIGLRMKPFLLLGRRGVFDGTVENMHLHWKYRELVKIISKDWCIQHVHEAARSLEAESGGILVAVERVSKGHAIIVYRGKNYRRPATLRPKTLLNKKQAMKRSLEAQRRESLKLHVLNLNRKINQLKHQMVMDNSRNDSLELTHPDASHTTTGKNQSSDSTNINMHAEYVCHQENIEAVDEADAESLLLNEHGAESVNVPTNDTLMAASEVVFSTTEVLQSYSEPGNYTSMSNDEVGCISDDPMLHPETLLQRSQLSCSTTNNVSPVSDEESEDLSFEENQSNPEPFVHNKIEEVFNNEIPFKAAALSNRERLILRKQALKMRKRPVLAVGRSNVISGVAKTIKSHFKKHPLAIVNVKGRAEGTSVQELIFELEQATGAVLVSREPNKVILYRGWGEEEEAPGMKGRKDAENTRRRATFSPQLIAAVRRECGLQTGQLR